MSTVTIEIAGDVAEDKFDFWLEVSDIFPTMPLWCSYCHACCVEFTVGEDSSE